MYPLAATASNQPIVYQMGRCPLWHTKKPCHQKPQLLQLHWLALRPAFLKNYDLRIMICLCRYKSYLSKLRRCRVCFSCWNLDLFLSERGFVNYLNGDFGGLD